MEQGNARDRPRADRLMHAERWVSMLHKAAMTALALVSLWLILR